MKELERLVLGHIHIRQLYHPQACLPLKSRLFGSCKCNFTVPEHGTLLQQCSLSIVQLDTHDNHSYPCNAQNVVIIYKPHKSPSKHFVFLDKCFNGRGYLTNHKVTCSSCLHHECKVQIRLCSKTLNRLFDICMALN